MKTTIFSIATMAFGLLSFAKDQNEINNSKAVNETSLTQTSFSTGEIISDYLKIKNALVKSDSKTTAQAAEALESTLKNSNVTQLRASQKPVFAKISEEAKKQAKVITANYGKLDKQRKAFQQLSKGINDLVAAFGTSQKMYQDFCPMYEGGSIWLSETKDIKNPYYGSKMLNCGKIKETIE